MRMAGFTREELDRARRYHRPRYAAAVADLALTLGTLAVLTQVHLSLRWWLAAAAMPALVAAALVAVRVPLGWWRYRRDLAWGLSTQSPGAWLRDLGKEAAVGVALAVLAVWPLFALAHRLPDAWPWVAAGAAPLLVFLLGFLAPVVLEPLFNRFAPLADEALARRLHALAEDTGVPVREILVADASRRTTRSNAYVSGIGRTRRVVLWDTLLASPADEIAIVLAHELAHRTHRHVAVLTAAAMAGAALLVGCIRAGWAHPVPDDTAAIVLLATALQLVLAPLLAALSRAFERVADRESLRLTGDRDAYRRLHHRLAIANLSDLQPPKWLYFWTYSHPTAPERLRGA
jgi:STE24 endopeptidase